MQTYGYIYYSDGHRKQVVHITNGGEANRRSAERSTAQAFEYELRTWTIGPKPSRYEVRQF